METKTVRNVDPNWLHRLNGEQVQVDVDVLGLMAKIQGWAVVGIDGSCSEGTFCLNESPEVADRDRPAEMDDPDDHLSFGLDECTAAINKYGWLVFHSEGRVVGRVGVLVPHVPDDGWGSWTPPARVWEPVFTGEVVEVTERA